MSSQVLPFRITRSPMTRQESRTAFIFLSPWIVGFVTLIAFPLFASIYYALTDWDLLTTPNWVGLRNFVEMMEDRLFWQSLKVTVTYALMRVPAGIVVGLGMAMILNSQIVRGRGMWRLLYYMPAVLPPVAVSLMWSWIFSPQDGILNSLLRLLGMRGLLWIQSETLVLPSFLIMAIWSLMGKNMLVYLAGLNSIPDQLLESASIDGANGLQTFIRVKIPMLTPVIFYELIMTLIESFKMFTQAYVMTEGGPRNASLFYVYYLYRNAFQYYEMGYASALAWILFLVILAFTLVVFRTSNKWVYYEAKK